MRIAGLLLIAAASIAGAQSAPRVASTLPASERAELEKIRKDVWVMWFAGDTAGMRKVLGPELVALSADEPRWATLEMTLAKSAEFKASGGRLSAVRFDSTTIHRFGDAVVMFSKYEIDLDNNGQKAMVKGRATEVFVRANGKWVHTSWHLDKVG